MEQIPTLSSMRPAGLRLYALKQLRTPALCLYAFSGITSPCIWRAIITQAERIKQPNDTQHLLHEHSASRKRRSSRSSFMDSTDTLESSPGSVRVCKWLKHWDVLGSQTAQCMERGITPNECLASGNDQPWTVCKTLNYLRVGGWCYKASLKKLNITSDSCVRWTTKHGASYDAALFHCAPQKTWLNQMQPCLPVSTTWRTWYRWQLNMRKKKNLSDTHCFGLRWLSSSATPISSKGHIWTWVT